MIALEDYHKLKIQHNFEEYPLTMSNPMTGLKDFLEFDQTDLDTRIHICSMLIRRSVGVTGGIYLPYDVQWFIENFIKDYQVEITEFWKTESYIKAVRLVQEVEMASQVVGTTYMYTVIEAYLRHKLGYRIFEDDNPANKTLVKLGIGDLYTRVRKGNYRVSRELHLIDRHFKARARNLNLSEENISGVQLTGRLTEMRNLNLHGRNQSMTQEGVLLSLLFALLHYCELEELIKNSDGGIT